MSCNEPYRPISFWRRIIAVWRRHERVYSSDLISNAFPPLLEPLIFLAGLGLGFGTYISSMGAIDYLLFLASGLIVTSSMYTSAFECTYGTYVRLEFDQVYDGMLAAPLGPTDLILGEVLFAGSKGFLFALAVLAVTWLLGIITYPLSIAAAMVGFICGLMFAALSLWITSMVKNMNHFNFYFTGLLSPMFFFSGAVFPLENLPGALRLAAEFIPLTHVVRMARAFCIPGGLSWQWFGDFAYCIAFTGITGILAVRGLTRRMID